MMIAPEWVYEELKGQPAEKILREIRAYRREIVHLKRILEADNRDELDEFMIKPSPDVQLACTRKYLAMARRALEEGGGKYPATKTEERAEEIYRRLEELTEIGLERSAFFKGKEVLRAEFHEGRVYRFEKPYDPFGDETELTEEEYGRRCEERFGEDPVLSREEFLDALREKVFLGEWKRHYRPYRLAFDGVEYMKVLDGEQWELRLEFTEGKPLVFAGDNAYPFGFGELVTLLGGKSEEDGD